MWTCPPVVLVVEDEAMIAMMVEDALAEAGYRPGGLAATETAALAIASRHLPDFAVLDINLGLGGSGLNVGRELSALGVRILYASGYCPGCSADMTSTGARACLSKPYRPDEVPQALDVLARLEAGDPPGVLPSSFHLLA